MHRTESAPGSGAGSNIDQISELSQAMGQRLDVAVREIEEINSETRILALNAKIQASRADGGSKAFGVVADEMSKLSKRTSAAATRLDQEVHADITELGRIISNLAISIRGQRLAERAYACIDIVDRNLYERSCDVRLWALDGLLREGLARRDEQALQRVGERFGALLGWYSVYHDVLLCDTAGRVLRSGRPTRFQTAEAEQGATPWFRAAANARGPGDYGFQGVHRASGLAGGQAVLVFAAPVRSGDGELLGVLATVFNWEALAQQVVSLGMEPEEFAQTRTMIVDGAGAVLADTADGVLVDTLDPTHRSLLNRPCGDKGYQCVSYRGAEHILAHAASPGYEGYRSGWHCVVLQALQANAQS